MLVAIYSKLESETVIELRRARVSIRVVSPAGDGEDPITSAHRFYLHAEMSRVYLL